MSHDQTNPLDVSMRRELARLGIQPKANDPEKSTGDDLSVSMRRLLPPEARAAYDANIVAKAQPTRNRPVPPAPQVQSENNSGTDHWDRPARTNIERAALGSKSGDLAAFEAVLGRLPLGDISEAERARIYADMAGALLTVKGR